MAPPLERIRALRHLAASTTFPAEAESARVKADELMGRFGVTEEQLAPPSVSVPAHPPQQPYRPPYQPIVTVVFTGMNGNATGGSFYVHFVQRAPNAG